MAIPANQTTVGCNVLIVRVISVIRRAESLSDETKMSSDTT